MGQKGHRDDGEGVRVGRDKWVRQQWKHGQSALGQSQPGTSRISRCRWSLLSTSTKPSTSQPRNLPPHCRQSRSAQLHEVAQDGKQSPSDAAPGPTTPANRAICSLSVTRSTGKLTSERRRRLRDNASTDLRPCSTIFKRNYAMLGVVFGAGFAFEMCVHPPAPNTPETIAETTGRMRC